MASYLINITKTLQKLTLSSRCRTNALSENNNLDVIKNTVLFSNSVRNTTNFFNKLPAEALWKGVTSVSNAGKKRGRGRTVSKRNMKDLNKGQIIGVGKANILWPGLNAPIIQGKELVERRQLPEDPDREKNLIKLRDSMGVFRRQKLSPFERGWTGAKIGGRSIGPPDPILDDNFEGFDTRALELKTVFNMKGNLGRRRRIASMVVTGNKQGLAGFALGKALEGQTALRKAKNRAAQKLMHIKLFQDHTVYHDFFTQFGATKIFVYRKPEGYGLVCHRAIRTICEVIGIKNLHAKVEGSTNVNHITKAFFLGLIRQKTHDQIAEEKGLHLVEMNEFGFPNVLASPSICRKEEEIDKDDNLDFKLYCFGGKVVLKRKKFPPFYTKLYSWQLYLKKQEKIRNQDKVRRDLITRYGEIRSFLTDQYPECKPDGRPKKHIKEQVEESN